MIIQKKLFLMILINKNNDYYLKLTKSIKYVNNILYIYNYRKEIIYEKNDNTYYGTNYDYANECQSSKHK